MGKSVLSPPEENLGPQKNTIVKKQSRRWLIGSIVLFLAVLFFLIVAEDEIEVSQSENSKPLQLVSIETVTLNSEKAEINIYGSIRPRWSAELRSAVSGRVTKVHAEALAGESVAKGTALIAIEKTPYVAEVAAAALALKEAELAVWQAKNKTTVARRMFKRSGKKPPNNLSLHLPQLNIAKSAVALAKARLASAQQRLENTIVTAPFSGHVTQRYVSPGQTVNMSDPLVKLVDDQFFEMALDVSKDQWALLQKPVSGLTAKLFNKDNDFIAEAKIRQAGGFLDEQTRQYKVFLDIENTQNKKILSGDFVKVKLPGRLVESVLNSPASALTQEGFIWYVDAKNHLQRFSPQIIFRRDDRIIIKAPEISAQQEPQTDFAIAITPLASFLPGQIVQPKKRGD